MLRDHRRRRIQIGPGIWLDMDAFGTGSAPPPNLGDMLFDQTDIFFDDTDVTWDEV